MRYAALFVAFCIASSTASYAAGKPALGDQVSGGIVLTQEEKADLEPVLAHYYALDGTSSGIQGVIQTAVDAGCRGDCVADLVSLVNTAMRSGANSEDAGKEVCEAIRAVKGRCAERGITATGPEITRAVRTRIEGKYKEQPETSFVLPTAPSGNK